MIKYKLICENCNLLFDSWFSSSNEYENLKNKDFLSCYNCDSKKIKKTLMAPKLIKETRLKKKDQNSLKSREINEKVKKYQKFIKNNFEYVGKNFAYEARLIHYENKKKDKKIYGTASTNEIKELKEEGIQTEMIPWVNDKSN